MYNDSNQFDTFFCLGFKFGYLNENNAKCYWLKAIDGYIILYLFKLLYQAHTTLSIMFISRLNNERMWTIHISAFD